MNRVKHLGITLAVVISLFLIFSQTAYASVGVATSAQTSCDYYLGVGTFRMIVQLVVGTGIAALAMIVTVYRVRVRNFFSSLINRRRNIKGSDDGEVQQGRTQSK